jgi:hypothetical protein
LEHDIQSLKVLLVLRPRTRPNNTLEVAALQIKQLAAGNTHQRARLRAALGGLPIHEWVPKDGFLANDVAASDYISDSTLPLDTNLQGSVKNKV